VDIGSIGGRCSDSRAATAVSRHKPWCSLATAAAKAQAGSTVLVRKGSYPPLRLASYAPKRMTTFRGYGSERPAVPGLSVGSGSLGVRQSPRSRNFTFRGFKFTNGLTLNNFANVRLIGNEIAITEVPPVNCVNAAPWGHCDVQTPNAISLTPPGANFVLKGNYIHNGNIGINTTQPGAVSPHQNFTIEDNKFAHMGGVVMVVNYAKNWTVRRNEFADNGTYQNIDPMVHPDSIMVVGADDGLMFDSNYVHSTTGGRGWLFGPTNDPYGGNCNPVCLYQTNIQVQNNVISSSANDFGIRMLGGVTAPKIVNNTIWMGGAPTPNTGLELAGGNVGIANVVLANNILRVFDVLASAGKVTFANESHNNVVARFTGSGFDTPQSGTQDIAAIPSFAAPDVPSTNLRLNATSPGINGGDPAIAPRTDHDGHARVGPPDIGAFEFGARAQGRARR
jgi:hypothetical protein